MINQLTNQKGYFMLSFSPAHWLIVHQIGALLEQHVQVHGQLHLDLQGGGDGDHPIPVVPQRVVLQLFVIKRPLLKSFFTYFAGGLKLFSLT